MNEKPILFNSDMVCAILKGRKTQTRRIVKPQPTKQFPLGFITCSTDKSRIGKYAWGTNEQGGMMDLAKPHYQVGDVLYVRETWCDVYDIKGMNNSPRKNKNCDTFYYKADYALSNDCVLKWRPSIHMPKSAARIFLKVADVRVEQVQDIAEADAVAEGVTNYWAEPHKDVPPFIGTGLCSTIRKAYQQLWDSIYAKQGYGWGANPWVWVISFERVMHDV